jgi:hypothetical protein
MRASVTRNLKPGRMKRRVSPLIRRERLFWTCAGCGQRCGFERANDCGPYSHHSSACCARSLESFTGFRTHLQTLRVQRHFVQVRRSHGLKGPRAHVQRDERALDAALISTRQSAWGRSADSPSAPPPPLFRAQICFGSARGRSYQGCALYKEAEERRPRSRRSRAREPGSSTRHRSSHRSRRHTAPPGVVISSPVRSALLPFSCTSA